MPVNKRYVLGNSACLSVEGSVTRPRAPRIALRLGEARALALVGAASLCLHAFGALADGGEHHVVPPPAPHEHGPTLTVEVHGSVEAPILRDTICPATHACVLGLGLGIGAQVEWRTADRIGLFAAYDFWMIDPSGVYELGALHALRGGVRYVLDDSLVVHPFLDIAAGVLAFGDTANVATGGGLLTLGGGAEIELSESVAFTTGAEAWLLATGPFTTRDGAARSGAFGVDIAVQLTLGVALLVGPAVAGP